MKHDPAEGPELLTVSVRYAGMHLGELLDAAADGVIIRILDLRRGEVRGYLAQDRFTPERPAALEGWPDDLELIQARIRRAHAGRWDKALSALQRKRAAS